MLTKEEAAAKLAVLQGKATAIPSVSADLPPPAQKIGQGERTAPPPVRAVREYRHYKPLTAAVDAFIAEAVDQERIFTGIEQLDSQMRGIGRGHLCGIVGASHSGKTQLLVQILKHNKDKRFLLFSPDETDTLVLAKLTARETGVSAELLEQKVAQRDEEYIELLRDIAEGQYPNLIVIDKPVGPDAMNEAWDEACEVWGKEPQGMAFDYVQLLLGPEDARQQMDALKAFGKRKNCPFIVIHQTSRGSGKEGQSIGIDSGSYGGETHFTFMIGVRRKEAALSAELRSLRDAQLRGKDVGDRIAEVEHDLRVHHTTMTMNLVKNKRVGGQRVDDFDMEIMADTGALVTIAPGDLPRQYQAQLAANRDRNARFARSAVPSHTPQPDYSQQAYATEEML